MNFDSLIGSRLMKTGAALVLGVAMMAGCSSQQDKAIDAAKKQAAATGQTQQVVTVDKAGNTTTTTIQPPSPGQTAEAISTTTAPAPPQTPGGPLPTAPGTYYQPAGSRFDGEVVESWVGANGRVILPKGTPVGGVVDVSHKRGHFKGASVLELRLTSLTLNGTRYPLETRDLTRTKKGKGRRSAAMIGGGTGLGMLIGGVASGGTGLLIGGLAGAGAGTAVGGLTGNRDIVIPAESIVRFRLADDLTLQQ